MAATESALFNFQPAELKSKTDLGLLVLQDQRFVQQSAAGTRCKPRVKREVQELVGTRYHVSLFPKDSGCSQDLRTARHQLKDVEKEVDRLLLQAAANQSPPS